MFQFGSSPRVRGTVAPVACVLDRIRFIPACAGNRLLPIAGRRAESVHPRVCGEQATTFLNPLFWDGSSPRVRGTERSVDPGSYQSRFIPACAGNSGTAKRCDMCVPVHPRVCGEQVKRTLHPEGVFGSSPRVRGTDRFFRTSLAVFRFIPACAGNRRVKVESDDCYAVHPRVCGEQRVNARRAPPGDGSSPRVRGTGTG